MTLREEVHKWKDDMKILLKSHKFLVTMLHVMSLATIDILAGDHD